MTKIRLNILALSVALVAGSVSLAGAEPLKVTIGMPAPITGPSANFGDSMVKGAQIAIDQEKHAGCPECPGRCLRRSAGR
jgi:ABC-type branched-subunit amino acid transport system substrate-binding protein